MPTLGAIDPHGVLVGNIDAKGAHLVRRETCCGGDEAGVEASDVAVHGDGLAGLVEGGLGDGVVARGELELHHLADIDPDVVGRECEAAVQGDCDDGSPLGCTLLSASAFPHPHFHPWASQAQFPICDVPDATLARAARASVVNCILNGIWWFFLSTDKDRKASSV